MNLNRRFQSFLSVCLALLIVFSPLSLSLSEISPDQQAVNTEPAATETVAETQAPTPEPTAEPTAIPTPEATAEPTQAPTAEPTAEPATQAPTVAPTDAPSATPSSTPTEAPAATAADTPTQVPEPTATALVGDSLADMPTITRGYVRALTSATLHATARKADDAQYQIAKDSVLYALERPDAGQSPDRLLVAWHTGKAIETAYVSASALYPLTDAQASAFTADAARLSVPDVLYVNDDATLPLLPVSYTVLAVTNEAPAADTAGEPTATPEPSVSLEPFALPSVAPDAAKEPGKLASQVINKPLSETANLSGAKTTTYYVTSIGELQSSHSYSSNSDIIWVYTVPDAARITVSFSSDTYVERNYDFIVFYDAAGNYYARFTGDELAGRSVTVRGDRMYIRLLSDWSLNYYGFRAVSSSPYTRPNLTSCYATGAANSIQLRWANVSFIDGFYIYRATTTQTGRTGAFSYLAYVPGNQFSYVDRTAVSGQINSYKVLAYTKLGTSTYRSGYSNILNMTPLQQPSITSVTKRSSSSVTVSWQGVSGATLYNIYSANTADGTYTLVGNASGAARSMVISGLESRPYYFKIRAGRTIDASTYLSPYSAAKLGVVGMAAPTITGTHSPNATSMTVNWSSIAGVTGYQVFRADTAAGPYSTYVGFTSATTLTDRAAPRGRYSYYKVRAVASAGGTNVYSDMSAYCSAFPLDVPSGIKLTRLSETSAKLSWNGSSGATGYQIYTSVDGATYQLAATVSSTARTYTASFTAGTEFAYCKMRAIRIGGTKQFNSNMSGATQVKLSSSTYRALVIGQTYAGTGNALNGTRNDATAIRNMLNTMSATGYQVTYRIDLSASGILSNITSAFSGATSNDVSLFYYSGHGLLTSDSDWLGSLCGVDDQFVNPTALRNRLDTIPGKKIIIIDACHSGNMIGKSADTASTDAFTQQFINAFANSAKSNLATGGYYVLVAASKTQSSYETNVGGVYAGMFTRGVCYGSGWNEISSSRLSSLNADANGDSFVALNELYNYVTRYVSNAGYSGYQTTQVYPTGSTFPLYGR